jgi:hypothetical protein
VAHGTVGPRSNQRGRVLRVQNAQPYDSGRQGGGWGWKQAPGTRVVATAERDSGRRAATACCASAVAAWLDGSFLRTLRATCSERERGMLVWWRRCPGSLQGRVALGVRVTVGARARRTGRTGLSGSAQPSPATGADAGRGWRSGLAVWHDSGRGPAAEGPACVSKETGPPNRGRATRGPWRPSGCRGEGPWQWRWQGGLDSGARRSRGQQDLWAASTPSPRTTPQGPHSAQAQPHRLPSTRPVSARLALAACVRDGLGVGAWIRAAFSLSLSLSLSLHPVVFFSLPLPSPSNPYPFSPPQTPSLPPPGWARGYGPPLLGFRGGGKVAGSEDARKEGTREGGGGV